MKRIKLGDVCHISSAGDKPSEFSSTLTGEYMVPVVANGVENNGIIGYTSKPTVTEPAVTVSARGNVGAAFFRDTPYYPVIRLLTLIPNSDELDVKYLYYYLKKHPIKGDGSVQAQITVPDAKQYAIFAIEDVSVQKKIASVLSCLDAKIENNNAICADLEGMAKLLYDYWFVQFDFPDENGKPYKSSGGKMVWNEELKREIPEGWEAGYLKNLFEKVNESILAEKKGNLPYTPMDSLPMKQLTFGERFDNKEANSSLIRYKKYDILFGAMRAYFHRVCIAPYEGITRTTTFVLRPLEMNQLGFAYETINQDVAVAYAVKRSVGTQQPYAEWDNNFDSFAFALPPKNLITIYSQKVQGIIDACIHYQAEVAELASLRDFLLPMLMNGQVKVKGA